MIRILLIALSFLMLPSQPVFAGQDETTTELTLCFAREARYVIRVTGEADIRNVSARWDNYCYREMERYALGHGNSALQAQVLGAFSYVVSQYKNEGSNALAVADPFVQNKYGR